jgi:hypothetical protein
LRAAQAGYAGVNLHSGGEGYYAPIVGEPDATKLRPEYFGLLLAQFTGATFTGVSLAGEAPGVNVYAARGKNVRLIAMVKSLAILCRRDCMEGSPMPRSAGS